MTSRQSPDPSRTTGLTWPQIGFLALLAGAGIGLLGWSILRYFVKPTVAASTDRNIVAEVKDYLRLRNVKPLSEPLAKLLADAAFVPLKTQDHPLVNQPAPGFELVDSEKNPWKLGDSLKRGPVVLVFYFGYHCNHCVGQLFAVNNDLPLLKELGATVIAVSADPADLTRQRFKQYGTFAFPVLSDPGNQTAARYGVFKAGKSKDDDILLHGTFIIDRDGIVRWANAGDEPFTENRSLLHILATLGGNESKTKAVD